MQGMGIGLGTGHLAMGLNGLHGSSISAPAESSENHQFNPFLGIGSKMSRYQYADTGTNLVHFSTPGSSALQSHLQGHIGHGDMSNHLSADHLFQMSNPFLSGGSNFLSSSFSAFKFNTMVIALLRLEIGEFIYIPKLSGTTTLVCVCLVLYCCFNTDIFHLTGDLTARFNFDKKIFEWEVSTIVGRFVIQSSFNDITGMVYTPPQLCSIFFFFFFCVVISHLPFVYEGFGLEVPKDGTAVLTIEFARPPRIHPCLNSNAWIRNMFPLSFPAFFISSE